jgi:UDP-N-acetyl-D-galactosamine dehydrogenase
VLGLTFKENCPDLRSPRVVDIVDELSDYGGQVDCFDPWVNPKEAEHEYGITQVQSPENSNTMGLFRRSATSNLL